jgi:hypothetical protein
MNLLESKKMMTDKQALLYVAEKIGIQCQYYLDTNETRYLEAMVAYIKVGNTYIERIENAEDQLCNS